MTSKKKSKSKSKTKKVKKKSKKVKKTTKLKKQPKQPKDPNVLEIVEKEVEINCPVRGKIKQIFKVKVLKPVKVEEKRFIEPNDYIEKIEDDDMPIYGSTEPDQED